MKRPVSALSLCLLTWGGVAAAGEPIRVHVEAGASHAVTGEQASEFGGGGEGKATVEVAPTARVGLQAGAGAIVLAKGDSGSDRTVTPTSTGTAFLGTMGLRFRAFGPGHAGGPWADSNMGVAHTGDVTRPAFDAHIGWDVRAAADSRLDVGPYVGYTQIFQPDAELRGADARILTVGIQIGLGAKAEPRVAPPSNEAPPPPVLRTPIAAIEDHDGAPEASDSCPAGAPAYDDGCVGDMHIFHDRIFLADTIHFDFGSAHVRADSFRVVKKLAQFIGEHDEIVKVSIEGHADEVGTYAYNQELSVERADAMRQLLIWFGAPAQQLRVVGYGKTQPKIFTLKPEEQNRRVELFVTTLEQQTQRGAAANATHGKSTP